MFTKSTKHYMTIEVTCTDTDPLTTEDIDPTGMYTAFAKYWSKMQTQNPNTGTYRPDM
jgi:hypothetical protein